MNLQAERKRPDGVTILGIFGIISSIVSIISGIGLALLVWTFSVISEPDMYDALEEEFPDAKGTDVATALNEVKKLHGFFILGIFLIPLGIAGIIVSWGLLKSKGWAWIGAVIVTAIFISYNVLSIPLIGTGIDVGSMGGIIVSFIISGVILWYLYRQNVRLYFGRVKIQAP